MSQVTSSGMLWRWPRERLDVQSCSSVDLMMVTIIISGDIFGYRHPYGTDYTCIGLPLLCRLVEERL